jgi:putative transposase
MRGPRPSALILSESQRKDLEAFARRHSSPQQSVLRARIVLAAADGLNNSQVARLLAISIPTARAWRDRWVGLQAAPEDDLGVDDRLADAPRSGRPPRITAEQVCQVVALACEAPATSGRPITHWTGREVADEIIKRGIVDRISPRHAGRLLKTDRPEAPPGPALADPQARRGLPGRRRGDVRPVS